MVWFRPVPSAPCNSRLLRVLRLRFGGFFVCPRRQICCSASLLLCPAASTPDASLSCRCCLLPIWDFLRDFCTASDRRQLASDLCLHHPASLPSDCASAGSLPTAIPPAAFSLPQCFRSPHSAFRLHVSGFLCLGLTTPSASTVRHPFGISCLAFCRHICFLDFLFWC